MLIYGIPCIILILVILTFVTFDYVALAFNLSNFFAALFAYLSALILLLELIHEAGIKVYSKHLGFGHDKNTNNKLDLRIPLFYWSLTYMWFVAPVDNFVRKVIGVQPFGWSEEEDKINTYKLRFIAFIFLILAINFDICTRLFGN
jgi:hypothetical protein